jgi:hypothetical protein
MMQKQSKNALQQLKRQFPSVDKITINDVQKDIDFGRLAGCCLFL